MKKLDALLPIHAVRERRAQRLYHEQTQAYERALLAQQNASATLVRLQKSSQAALAGALEGGAKSAAYAQALLEQAAVAQREMSPAQKHLNHLQAQAQQALAVANEARVVYASKVCTHQKMRDLCGQEESREAKAMEARTEAQADDEFLAPWLAQQQRLRGLQ